MKISVSDTFDGGNIEFVEHRTVAGDFNLTKEEVVLNVKPDVYTDLEHAAHLQYFCFRVIVQADDDAADTADTTSPKVVKFILDNAEFTSYPEAWTGFTVFASQDVTDPDSWRRNVDTHYGNGKLTWEQEFSVDNSSNAKNNVWYYSFFPPYSYDRHNSFLSKIIANCNAKCTVTSLGQSLQGRDIECIATGTGDRTAWIIHRQHPGESMAEYFAEGLITELLGLDRADGVLSESVQELLSKYTFYIVPCMCPDGSVMGHLRTNSSGANLNREWCSKGDYKAPSLERSPEVYFVMKKMDETGVDFFLDVHGDEELPYNFISGARHIPAWCDRLERLHGAFTAEYERTTSDFQRHFGYPPPDAPEDTIKYMNVATNQIGNRFACLSMTLEMPFKDCLSNPDPEQGWSPDRSRKLGAAVVAPLLYVHPHLRDDNCVFPETDNYVIMTDDYTGADTFDADAAADNGGFVPLKKHKRFYSDVHEIHKPAANH